jgi:hypothetical protein
VGRDLVGMQVLVVKPRERLRLIQEISECVGLLQGGKEDILPTSTQETVATQAEGRHSTISRITLDTPIVVNVVIIYGHIKKTG